MSQNEGEPKTHNFDATTLISLTLGVHASLIAALHAEGVLDGRVIVAELRPVPGASDETAMAIDWLKRSISIAVDAQEAPPVRLA